MLCLIINNYYSVNACCARWTCFYDSFTTKWCWLYVGYQLAVLPGIVHFLMTKRKLLTCTVVLEASMKHMMSVSSTCLWCIMHLFSIVKTSLNLMACSAIDGFDKWPCCSILNHIVLDCVGSWKEGKHLKGSRLIATACHPTLMWHENCVIYLSALSRM